MPEPVFIDHLLLLRKTPDTYNLLLGCSYFHVKEGLRVFAYIQQKIAVVATLVIFAVPAYGQVENAFPVAAPEVICEVTVMKSENTPQVKDVNQIIQFANDEEQRIAESLNDRVKFKFRNANLREALKQIQSTCGINIGISERELENNIGARVIDIELSGISLRSALKLILEKEGLGYVIDNEILRVTTSSIADNWQYVRIYDVTEFKGDREPRLLTGLYVIADELEGIDSGDSKKPVYGKSKTGERIFSVSSVDDGLIIRANQKTHHEIEEMIALLRKHQQGKQSVGSNVQQAASQINWNTNYTSYLDEPSAFDEVTWDFPSLNEWIPVMAGLVPPSAWTRYCPTVAESSAQNFSESADTAPE